MKRILFAILLLLAAYPLREQLRAERPASLSAERLGTGRLWGGVLSGAFRPLLLNYLWIRADILQGQGRTDELALHYRMTVALYPRNARAREFLGHLLAYNLKEDAPDVELAWLRAREGLEILAGTDQARRALASWFMKQGGQNVFDLQRYAGEAWEKERVMRRLEEAWASQRLGRPCTRFEAALAFLGAEEEWNFFDRVARAQVLLAFVVDEVVRTGSSGHFAEAIAANRWAASTEGFADNPALAVIYAQQAILLGEIEKGAVSERTLSYGRYEVACCLWAMGAHRRDLMMVRSALDAFDRYEFHPCLEEKALVRAWIAHLEAGAGPPPPLPFDGDA